MLSPYNKKKWSKSSRSPIIHQWRSPDAPNSHNKQNPPSRYKLLRNKHLDTNTVFALPAFTFSIICVGCSWVSSEINWTGPRGITSFSMEWEPPSARYSLGFFQMGPVRRAKRRTNEHLMLCYSTSILLSSSFSPICTIPREFTRWFALAYTNTSLPYSKDCILQLKQVWPLKSTQ